MVGSSLVDSDGENLALLCQLSQGTARWWHGVWLQGKKGKLNQLWCISLQSRACAQSVIAAQLSHSASYRHNSDRCPCPMVLQLQTKASSGGRGGRWLCCLHSAGSFGEEGTCPASCQTQSQHTGKLHTHTCLSKWRHGDAGTASGPTRTLSAGAQGRQGCPCSQ